MPLGRTSPFSRFPFACLPGPALARMVNANIVNIRAA
jgi:hypothetical protein